MEPENPSNLFDLHVDQHSSAFLLETARWARFLAIIGFIGCGFGFVFSIFGGSYLAGNYARTMGGQGMVNGVFVSFFYIVVVLLYFFPFLYLYNFSSKMREAIRSNDQQLLNISFRNLKSYFKFLGILTIICLAFVVIAFFFGIMFAAAFH